MMYRKITHNEEGNTLFLVLGFMFILIAFFGLAVDSAMTVNARQEIANTLANATVTAVTQTGQNTEVINYPDAYETFIEVYQENRTNAPVSCGTQAHADAVGGVLAGNPSCPFVVMDFETFTGPQTAADTNGRYVRPSVYAAVYECSPNFFLNLVKDETCFAVDSYGRLSNVRE